MEKGEEPEVFIAAKLVQSIVYSNKGGLMAGMRVAHVFTCFPPKMRISEAHTCERPNGSMSDAASLACSQR